MKSAQEILSNVLDEHGLQLLLIGGMALPAFDVVRQTIDVDCLIASNDKNLLDSILAEAGYSELKDLGDIVEIIRNNSSEINDSELESICLRYGSEGVYKKILEAV